MLTPTLNAAKRFGDWGVLLASPHRGGGNLQSPDTFSGLQIHHKFVRFRGIDSKINVEFRAQGTCLVAAIAVLLLLNEI